MKGIYGQWQADLGRMPGLSRENHGTNYKRTVIDIFSIRARAIQIKNKSGKEMLIADQQLSIKAHPTKPARLHTEAGTEFVKKKMQGYVKREKVQHFTSNSHENWAVV